jgi:hypothetical protein
LELERWEQNGGDLNTAVDVVAKTHRSGVVLRIDIEWRSLKQARDHGFGKEREEMILQKAWQTTIENLPPVAVGQRTAWSRFEFVLEGTQGELSLLGSRLLHLLIALDNDNDLKWQIVFTEITADPKQTFSCDPDYELKAWQGQSVIAWVTPYLGADWKETRRYPTVSFLSK